MLKSGAASISYVPIQIPMPDEGLMATSPIKKPQTLPWKLSESNYLSNVASNSRFLSNQTPNFSNIQNTNFTNQFLKPKFPKVLIPKEKNQELFYFEIKN